MVVVQVVHACFSWVFLVACARVVGGLLFSCARGVGLSYLWLVCCLVALSVGYGFSILFRADALLLCFRGGVVRLSVSLVAFWLVFCHFPSF